MDALRRAVTPLRGTFPIISSHGASFGSCVLTDLDRFGVYAEHVLSANHCLCHVFAYFFAKNCCQLSALIVLSVSNQGWKFFVLFGMEPLEKIIFTVESVRLGCCRKCDGFEVGKLGYDAAMWAVFESTLGCLCPCADDCPYCRSNRPDFLREEIFRSAPSDFSIS